MILKHLNLWDSPRRAPPRKVPLLIQGKLWPKYPNSERRMALPQTAESREPYSFDPVVPTDIWCQDPEYEYV
ncbi:MAG: hypothetical protein HYU64_20030 [Armatimonadetes bacterium]|nr:hypothetical protein [Armatimonadota bacterium]